MATIDYYAIHREVILTDEQLAFYDICHKANRCAYNLYIEMNIKRLDEDKPLMSAYEFMNYFNHHIKTKESYAWLKNANQHAIKQSILQGEQAFKNFFESRKKGDNHFGFPKFRSAKKDTTGITLPRSNKNYEYTKLDRNKAKIPAFKWIKFYGSMAIPDNLDIVYSTLTKVNNKNFISFTVRGDCSIEFEKTDLVIGVDLGIKTYAYTSTGYTFENLKNIKQLSLLADRIKKTQRKLSRMEIKPPKDTNLMKGERPKQSNNYNKAKIAFNDLWYKVKCIRKGIISKILGNLARYKPKAIVVETLNLKGMLKNRRLSKSIQDSFFYYFLEQLKWFCAKRGIELIPADMFYPSTQTCSNCGNVKKGSDKLKLYHRTYKCDVCGLELDRDYNASLVLRNLGIKILSSTEYPNATREI